MDAAALATRLMDAFDAVLREPGGFARLRDAMAEEDDFDAVAERIGGEMGRLQRELIPPDIEFDYSALAAQSIDAGPVFRGHGDWVKMWRFWLEPWESYEFGEREIERIDEARALLSSVQVYRGRTSGAQVEIKQVGVWTARDGKLVSYRAFDTRDEAMKSIEEEQVS